MTLESADRLKQIPADQWDALFPPDYPFTRHRFLSALETHGCVSEEAGWSPQHLLLKDDDGRLLAACPAYLKAHSYGEFVFDFAWAQASAQIGQPYYPKLLVAIPFTPASGPRIGATSAQAQSQLLSACLSQPEHNGLSSAHILFPDAPLSELGAECGALLRTDLQYHWHNASYRNFDDFLRGLSSKRRKQIRRERRQLTESGFRFETLPGDQLNEAQWDQVYALYAHTYHQRGQAPYLSRDFWLDYGAESGTPVRVSMAWLGTELIACALMIQGGNTLYGRHWGSKEFHDGLHFETCYYRGIEWCIQQGLTHFDAGTQGQHKQARGFDPSVTTSLHVLRDERLRAAVAEYLHRERIAIADARQELLDHSAYRRPADGQSNPSALVGSS